MKFHSFETRNQKGFSQTVYQYRFIKILLFLFTICSSYGQLDEITMMVNGKENTISGKIKLMEKNTLTVGTSYSKGDFKISWTKVKTVFSTRLFLVTLKDGRVLNASINTDTSNAKGNLLLWYFDREDTVQLKEVVHIKPLEKTFFSRLKASLDFGYNLSKSNDLRQLSARSNLGYLSNFWLLNGSYDAITSKQENTDQLNRTNANVNFQYFLQKRYYLTVSADFLRNDEQLLALRSATRAGLGNYIVRSNKLYLSTSIGGVWNNEKFNNEQSTTKNSVESFLAFEANLFNIGKFYMLTSAIAYPSLTEKGRFRTDFRVDLRYSLPYNFYFKVGYTLNYDNKPVDGAIKNDYVLQTTIGWSYN